jgi:hypothetical protein
MDTRKKEDFNNNLQTAFNLLSIKGKYNIVGSAALKCIHYAADYDLNEKDVFKGPDAYNHIYQIFRKKFLIAKSNPNIFIIDFKCGLMENAEPIRWTYTKLMKSKNQFIDALKQISTTKLDIIYLLNGVYVDITEIYFFNINSHTNFDNSVLSKSNIKIELKKSISECVENDMYYKALKRLFSYLNISNNFNPDEKLVTFFNSSSGVLYKADADLNILIKLIENKFRKPKIVDIIGNLQIIKSNLSVQNETKQNVSMIIDNMCKLKKMNCMIIFIKKLSNYISKIYNADAKLFYEENYKKFVSTIN